MPKLTNKVTGEHYFLTKEEWERIKSPAYLRAFDVLEVTEPEAVTALKESKVEEVKQVKRRKKSSDK